MKTFRLAVCDTRTFDDYPILRAKLDALLSARVAAAERIVILQGGARGADAKALLYSVERGYECVEFPADWDTHGRAAGPIRNRAMVAEADALVAFWDGQSPGTRDAIEVAMEKGLPVRVIRYNLES